MYDKHLDAFVCVAETGSFSAAADKLYISRTALIQQVNLLEQRIDLQLFVRGSKGVTLTAAGKVFYEDSLRMIRMSQRTLHKCKALQDKNTVRLGTLPNFMPSILSNICRDYAKIYPGVQIQFLEFPLKDYFDAFQNNEFDITTSYMAGYHYDHPDYRLAKLTEDKHCCGVPHNHPLAARESLSPEDLDNQTVVMYKKGITRADDSLRKLLLQQAPHINFTDITSYDRMTALECELSSSILIYYSMYWENFAPLITVPLDIPNLPTIDIGLGYKADASQVVLNFIDVAKNMFR